MKPVKLTENIYWVGVVDWRLRNFHGYMTQRGSSYNAYLIIDEKITLIDTVKAPFCDEMLTKISAVIDPSKIDYIISNLAVMDHSGAIPELAKRIPNVEIIASANGEKALKEHFKENFKIKSVKAGDKLNTGKYTFTFVPEPMVHWPDSMVTYLEEERILFSNDAFGQHIATSERFDYEYSLEIIMEEARKYYANIVLPYSQQVQRALKDLSGLKIDIIATSHGIIWRQHVSKIMAEYQKWSSNEYKKKALVIYDTMWHSTEKMAETIASAFSEKGYNYRLMSLQDNHISDIMTEILEAEYICVGSPTLNNNMLPTVAAFLTYLKGLAPKERKAMAFGSYGWGGQSVKQVHEALESCGFTMLEPVSFKYIPDEEFLKTLREKVLAAI
jgi:flavorubredoxin